MPFDLRPCGLEVGELVALEAHVEDAALENEFVLTQSDVRDIGPPNERPRVRALFDEASFVNAESGRVARRSESAP